MKNLIKSIALLIPSIRNIHAERNLYAEKVQLLEEKDASNRKLMSDLLEVHQSISNNQNALIELNRSISLNLNAIRNTKSNHESRRLHIVGYARSGTTILMDILNSSNEIFIFSELNLHVLRKLPELFSAYSGANFLDHFNARKAHELPVVYKSAHINLPPTDQPNTASVDDALNQVGKRYRYFGDKIATCNRTMGGYPDLELLKEFLVQEDCLLATFLFTLRRPSEILYSANLMFSSIDFLSWGKSVAETNIAIIKAYLVGNHAALVFHEDISPDIVGELEQFVCLDLPISRDIIGSPFKSSLNKKIDVEDAWVLRLDATHEQLYDIFRCDKQILKRSRSDYLIKRIALIIRELESIVAEISDVQIQTELAQ